MRAYSLDASERSYGPEDLRAIGVLHWRLDGDDAQRDAAIDEIKRERGYVAEDVVALKPDTPNLEAICAKFDKEHQHTLDEVRYVIDGEGIFDVRDGEDRWVRIEVSPADLIVIPAGKYHRFYLTDRKHIECRRLFLNHDGWAPLYREG